MLVGGTSVGEAVGVARTSVGAAVADGKASVGDSTIVVDDSVDVSARSDAVVDNDTSAGIGEVFKLAYWLLAYMADEIPFAQALVAAVELSIG